MLHTDISGLDDTLAKKGFTFEKVDGLVMKYKKNSNRLEFLATPKELTYTFTERGFFLKINSELTAQNYQLVNGEEVITVQGKTVKAAYLKKDGEKVYLWSSVDDASKKTYFSLKIQVDLTAPKATPAAAAEPAFVFKNPYVKKAVPTNTVKDTNRVYPKPIRVNYTLGTFKFIDPDNGYSSLCRSLHMGIQVSSFAKKLPKNKMVADKGGSIDFSFFSGMDYGWKDAGGTTWIEYITLRKHFLTVNQYIVYDLKFAEFKFAAGPHVSYNQGIADVANTTVGFVTGGMHVGEYLQKGFGTKTNGYSKRMIGIGFDHYFSLKGCYIGSFGLTMGF